MALNDGFLSRGRIISYNLGKPVFIIQNPITLLNEAYINLSNFQMGNPNVNNYNEISGKNITDYLNDKHYSIYRDNVFQKQVAEQAFEKIPEETLIFPLNYVNWLWLK